MAKHWAVLMMLLQSAIVISSDLAACLNKDEPAARQQQLLQASKLSSAGQVSDEVAEQISQGHLADLDLGFKDIHDYVDSLAAKTTSHNYSMNSAEETALDTIKAMVRKMLKASDQQHSEDQGEVNRSSDLIKACSTDAQIETVASYKQSAQTARKSHADCRIAQGSKKAAMDLACASYAAYRQSSTPPACAPTKLTADFVSTSDAKQLTEMEACLEAMNEWLPPMYAKYAACTQTQDQHSNWTGECNRKQTTFETAFCIYSLKLQDACDYQSSCRQRTIAASSKTYASVKVSEAARKADFETGSRILCLFGVIQANNTHKQQTLQECRKLSVQTSKYDIVYQSTPAATVCVKEHNKPCDSDWMKAEYQTQSWHSKANSTSCNPCLAPTTTTTTTTTTATTSTTTTTTATTTTSTTTAQVVALRSCIIKSKEGKKKASCNAGWCDFKAYPSYNCKSGPTVDECHGKDGIKLCKEKIKQKKPFPNGKVYQMINHVTGSTRDVCVGDLVEKSTIDGVKEFWFPHGGWQDRGDRHMWFYCG